MISIDLPPKPGIWLPLKPGIIRQADDLAAYQANLGVLLCAARRRAAGAVDATVSFISQGSPSTLLSTADQTTYTYSGALIGTVTDRSLVVVSVAQTDTNVNQLVSATIGGVSATIHANITHTTTADTNVAIFSAVVPSGTTADIVVTWNESAFRSHIAVHSLYNLNSTTPHDTQTDTADACSVTIAVPAGGVCVAASAGVGGTSPGMDWTGVNEDYDRDGEGSNETLSGGAIALSAGDASRIITASMTGGTFGEQAMAAVSWR